VNAGKSPDVPITRRRFLRTAAAAAAGTWAAGRIGRAGAAPSRPNVLLIAGDDHGAEMGCAGTVGLHTPNMDALAARGVMFRQSFCTMASCSPSRASMMTGLYPHSHGLLINCFEFLGPQPPADWLAKYDATNRQRCVREDVPTLIEGLRAAGYRTGISHKFHMYPHSKFPFDSWITSTADSVQGFLAARDDRPFFLMHNIASPHRPFAQHLRNANRERLDPATVRPPGFLPDVPVVREDWAEYLTCVEITDQKVGEALAALEASGHSDDTVVIYVGDNGPSYHRGKMTVYDYGLRVAMIVAGPGVQQGVTTHELTSLADLMPTVMDYAGAPLTRPVQAMSLRPLLEGQPGARGHDLMFGEVHVGVQPGGFEGRSVFDGRWHYIRQYNTDRPHPLCADDVQEQTWGNRAYQATIDAREQFPEAYALLQTVVGPNPPREQLFDLEADRWETKDLARTADAEPVRVRLSAALDRWQQETEDRAAVGAQGT
jgi:N-sulfoglucosamine sulfohydrolase